MKKKDKMKQNISHYIIPRILVFLLLVASIKATAQEKQESSRFSIGVQVGIGFANLSNAKNPEVISFENSNFQVPTFEGYVIKYPDYQTGLIANMQTGLTFGLALDYQLKENISLRSIPSYERKGIKLVWSGTSEGPSENGIAIQTELLQRSVDINYISVPILIKRTFPGKVNYFIEGGFYTGFLLSVKGKNSRKTDLAYFENGEQTSSDSFQGGSSRVDKDREYSQHMDYGLSLGAGVEMPISERVDFVAEALINKGLRKVAQKVELAPIYGLPPTASGDPVYFPENYYGFNAKTKNINMTVRIGVQFTLGRKAKE
ncbi:MAG: hypothetical protein ACJA2S_003457 [Cyclobacteriaceae bacterium]|jgi:hypothetical protein